MNKWVSLNVEYIYSNSEYGSVRKEKCLLPNGSIIEDYYITEFPNWVNAVVLTKENEIVLVKQYRHGVRDFFLEIPAGIVKQNENPVDAIIREVREETGYSSHKRPIYLGSFYPNPAVTTNKVISYMIVDAEKKYSQNLDENEELGLSIFHFERVGQLIDDNQFNHLFSVSTYLLAKNFLNK